VNQSYYNYTTTVYINRKESQDIGCSTHTLPLSADVHVHLPYANSLRDKFLAAIANKLDTKDCISIYEITRKLAGLNSIYKFGCC
jgi:hypothetical protein